jgi:hypothetical protein
MSSQAGMASRRRRGAFSLAQKRRADAQLTRDARDAATVILECMTAIGGPGMAGAELVWIILGKDEG